AVRWRCAAHALAASLASTWCGLMRARDKRLKPHTPPGFQNRVTAVDEASDWTIESRCDTIAM
ncbi:MAG TPA: hypothetical protein VGS80_00695, partial [Ktedonobacterales bacterium]|nr:hypothetical protein [Ktedonobacterales bacterium]